MSYMTQHVWDWSIAVYLFLGGMGAMMVALSIWSHMYYKPQKNLVIWSVFAGNVMLNVGSLFLFIHLLNHMAVIHVLNPMAIFTKPDAWIAWGTQFIVLMSITSVLYAIPFILENKWLRELPGVGPVLAAIFDFPLIKLVGELLTLVQMPVGWIAASMGLATAIYTGLLLQSFPAVALWHNPGVPILFTVSATSTALAAMLIILYTFLKNEEDHDLRHFFEKSDLILIGFEIFIIFGFFHFTLYGSESGYRTAELLWNDMGWIVGFIVFGLVTPFLLELWGTLKGGWNNPMPVITASLLVLMGGYLLRHYFLIAGVYEYPW